MEFWSFFFFYVSKAFIDHHLNDISIDMNFISFFFKFIRPFLETKPVSVDKTEGKLFSKKLFSYRTLFNGA